MSLKATFRGHASCLAGPAGTLCLVASVLPGMRRATSSGLWVESSWHQDSAVEDQAANCCSAVWPFTYARSSLAVPKVVLCVISDCQAS